MRFASLTGILAGLLTVVLVSACGPALVAMPTLPTAAPQSTPTGTSLPGSPASTLPPASPPSAAPGKPVQPLGTFPSIQSLHMFDANNGWGLTNDQVLRTTDGGTSWNNATPAGLTVESLSPFFLNPSSAWVLNGANPTSGTLYHTSDGGATWSSASVPFGGGYLQFMDAQNGWALVGLGAAMSHEAVAVFRTSDGGVTWSQVFTDDPQAPNTSDTLPFVGDKSGIAASDADHAWVAGSEPMSDFIYIYATQDGGKTWSGQNPPLPSSLAGAMTNAEPPHFFSSTEAVLPVRAFANNPALILYVSHDGGQSWSATAPVPINGPASLPTPTDFFAWDGGPTLYVSHDGGASWTSVTANVDLKDTFSSFQFVDANTGWAISSDASGITTLYRTLNGGVQWDVLNP